ncbi:MAG: hypothetical protein H6Q53_666 [Deltaproteobacteria bacterium]|nr:hypothetical protein [Deltaproteobacteria bacterium]
MDKVLLKKLLNVAQGSAPADTVIRNGKLVNVFTDSIEDNIAIVIKDGRIVSVDQDNGKVSFTGATEIDAESLPLPRLHRCPYPS